jgi:transcriptional regulator with XRE-family HTH domain
MNTTVKLPPRERLAAERLRRRWSQLEVADRLGTTPGNVSRWERGITSPGPYFRRKLCELFGKGAQDLGLTWHESDDSLDHNTFVSSSRNTSFFPGGNDLLAHVGTLLRSDPTTFPSIWASTYLAGVNLPEQEHADQGGLVQAITQWLQTRPNVVLILDNAEAVVIVAPKEHGCLP